MSIESISAQGAWRMDQLGRASGAEPARPTQADASSFGAMLEQGVIAANVEGQQADEAMTQLVQSQGANLHEAMIAMSRAEIATRLTLKVGQKLVQAYQEVSRMPL